MSRILNDFAAKVRKAKSVKAFEGRLLALDPGQTTGACIWDCISGEDDRRIWHGQLDTWPMSNGVKNFSALLAQFHPTLVVYESYNIYSWKLETHSFSDVPTLRIIGGMETQLLQLGIPYTHQSAQVAKTFVTDEKLHQFGYWEKGLKHSRDAHRHAIYFLCFGITAKN